MSKQAARILITGAAGAPVTRMIRGLLCHKQACMTTPAVSRTLQSTLLESWFPAGCSAGGGLITSRLL